MSDCVSWTWRTGNNTAPAGDWSGTFVANPAWGQVVLDNVIFTEGTGSYKHDNLHICPVGAGYQYSYRFFSPAGGNYVSVQGRFRLGGLDSANPGTDYETILAICIDSNPPDPDPEAWSLWFGVEVLCGASQGKLRVNGFPGTSAPSAGALSLNTWYKLQLDIYESVTGHWELYVNDVLWLSDTGDTRPYGIASVNRMLATGIYSPICDTTGNADVWVDDVRWYEGGVFCPEEPPDDWWDPIDDGVCVWGAWQAICADDIDDSLEDQSGSGHDLTIMTAPGWTEANGWQGGGLACLRTGFTPAADKSQSMIIMFKNTANPSGYLGGASEEPNQSRFWLSPAESGPVEYANGNWWAGTTAAITDGAWHTLCIAGDDGYLDGEFDATNADAWDLFLNEVYLLCINDGGIPTGHCGANTYIGSVAIYDCVLTYAQVANIHRAMLDRSDCPTPTIGPSTITEPHGGQARHTYGLTLKSSALVDPASPELGVPHQAIDITDLARDWTRSTRLQGGYWTGSFSMPLGKRAYEAFENWMGCHVEERSSGYVTWEGLVYEMELSYRGIVYRRSFEDMYNRVRVDYTDVEGTAQSTAWAAEQDSINRYGAKEIILTSSTEYDTVAEGERDRYLADHAWPWPKAVNLTQATDDKLIVTVNGYVFTMNWLYTTIAEIIEAPAAGGPYGTFRNCPGAAETTPCTCDDPGNNYCFEDSAASFATWSPLGITVPGTAEHSMWMTNDVAMTKAWGFIGEVTVAAYLGNPNMTYVHLYKVKDVDAAGPGDPTGIHGVNGTAGGGGVGAEEYTVRSPADEWVDGVETICPYIQTGYTQQNLLQPKRDVDDVRCWEALTDAILSDEAGNPWRLWVSTDRRLNYAEISSAFQWQYRLGRFLNAEGGPVSPWTLTPAVVRCMDWRTTPTRSGYWLEEPRDFLVEEFTVDANGNVTPRIADVATSELFTYQMEAMWAHTVAGGKTPTRRGELPPNWNVEAGTYNPPGPGGDLNGYWTEPVPGIYVWVHQMGLPGQPGS